MYNISYVRYPNDKRAYIGLFVGDHDNNLLDGFELSKQIWYSNICRRKTITNIQVRQGLTSSFKNVIIKFQ